MVTEAVTYWEVVTSSYVIIRNEKIIFSYVASGNGHLFKSVELGAGVPNFRILPKMVGPCLS